MVLSTALSTCIMTEIMMMSRYEAWATEAAGLRRYIGQACEAFIYGLIAAGGALLFLELLF